MRPSRSRCYVVAVLMGLACAALVGAGALFGLCGPFTDTAADAFCPLVLEIFYQGITTGTTPTTYSPGSNVTRLQMAAFLSRTVDGVLKRSSGRAISDRFWTPQNGTSLGLTSVSHPVLVASDGADLWVSGLGTVSRVRGSDGRLVETWTGAMGSVGVLVAIDGVFVTGYTNPGQLYRIDPRLSAGAVTTVASNVGNSPQGIAFDGSRIWTANPELPGSVSIVTPGPTIPWTVTTLTTGYSAPAGVLYDGANIWVSDCGLQVLRKLDGSGAILQTVTVGSCPKIAAFDGTNIWVPNGGSASVSVVRASSGAVLATLTGNGLSDPTTAAFDGQRVLVTNRFGDSVSLWNAADLATIGSVGAGGGTLPTGACSDGMNFWVALQFGDKLARF